MNKGFHLKLPKNYLGEKALLDAFPVSIFQHFLACLVLTFFQATEEFQNLLKYLGFMSFGSSFGLVWVLCKCHFEV